MLTKRLAALLFHALCCSECPLVRYVKASFATFILEWLKKKKRIETKDGGQDAQDNYADALRSYSTIVSDIAAGLYN